MRTWRARHLLVAMAAAVLLVSGVVAVTTTASADTNEAFTPTTVAAQRLIAAGGLHTCAVVDDGHVRCFGDNANGQLGNDTRTVSMDPVTVTGISNAVAVTAGNTHSCALLADTTVWCWGLNGNGQVGADPTVVNAALHPNQVPGLTDVRAVAAGGFHTCALLATGHVECWGLDGVGQLGDGAGTPSGDALDPVEVLGIDDALAVAAGEFHTCALVADGGVRCWGHNGFGQLGDGSTADTTTPVPVSGLGTGPGLRRAKAITAGYGHSCAIVDDGDPDVDEDTIRCWGENSQGQLGDGTTTDRSTPVTVQRDADPDVTNALYVFVPFTGADIVTGGQYHTCARTHDHAAWCWGNASRGQIGDGHLGDTNSSLPEDEDEGAELREMWRSARPVEGGSVDAITAGGFHSCAIAGGKLRCWGYDFYGQLGRSEAMSTSPVPVTALQGADAVAAGTGFACAAIDVPDAPADRHQPVCWGTNRHGELGAGLPPTVTQSKVAVAVASTDVSDVRALVAGNGHACALVVGSDTPWCWGRNDDGQVGDGSTIVRPAPVAVTGLPGGATGVVTGGRLLPPEVGHTCATASDLLARCWGSNSEGQLGDGTTTDRSQPVVVQYDPDPTDPDNPPVALDGVIAVATGGTHSCAVRSSSGSTQVWCWGRNLNGQLGDGTNDGRALAAPVKLEDNDESAGETDVLLTGVSSIVAGERHTCAVMTGTGAGGDVAGQVRCWGANERGQLGDGTTFERHLPKRIPSIPNGLAGEAHNATVLRLTAGDRHTCAVMANRSARCWGDDSFGQLGDGGGTGLSTTPVSPVGLSNDPADTIIEKLALTAQPDDLVTSLSASRANTCASLIDKTVRCWGSNDAGQLGAGVPPTATTPADVEELGGIGGNHPPTAVDDSATTAEDTAVSVSAVANDVDTDGDALVVSAVTDPAHGTATFAGGVVSYTPDPDFCGEDAVRYRAFDGRNAIADAVVQVTVTCVNDPPVAADDVASTPEDDAVDVRVLTNDVDADGDALAIASVTPAAHGTTAIVGNAVRYTPAPDANGPDGFTYTVSDGHGGTATAAVSVTVVPGNDAPTAADDVAATTEDTAVVIDVAGNDTDPDGDTLAVQSASSPAHGTTVVVPGGVRYTPAPDHTGSDSFTYVIGDGHGGIDSGSVSVSISPSNDGPEANDDVASTTRGITITVPVLANDVDRDGDSLSISSVTTPLHGTASIVAGGIQYEPAAGYVGPDSFSYVATDGNGGSDGASVAVTVGQGNYPPFAGDDKATTVEDVPVVIDVGANDYDPDAQPLAIAAVTAPAHGSVTVVSGSIRYTPAPDFWGTDAFEYTVDDGHGGSDTAAVAVTITSANDAPVAVADAAATSEDTSVVVPVLANDRDVDGDTLVVTSVGAAGRGTVAIVTGGVQYRPAPDATGSDTFTYTVSDGRGGTASATVSLTVAAVNDAPTLDPVADRSVRWGTVVTASATGHDVDGDALGYTVASGPGAISGDGTWSWTPTSTDVGSRTVTLRVSDGAASATRSFVVTVQRRPTTLTATAPATGQLSDPSVFGASLRADGGAPVGGAAVSFTAGGSTVSATTAGDGTTIASLAPAEVGSGSSSVTFAGSPAYEPSSAAPTPFTVVPEDAAVTLTGQHLTLTSGSSSTVALGAVVREVNDGSPAPASALAGASVRFTDLGGALLCSAPVTAAGPGDGTASCTTSALAVGARAVLARLVSPTYVAPLDVSAVAVAAVPSGAAAGAGEVTDANGRPAVMAFRAVPAKKGAPTGEAVQVFRQTADLGGGSRSYAFVVSGTGLTSLVTSCSTGKAARTCGATVQSGAATVAVDVLSGAVTNVPGATTLRIDATDVAEPSGATPPPDRYAAAVSGPRPFVVGSASDQRTLVRGNVRVPA